MRWWSKKVLITGGAGFIGSSVARTLANLDAEIIIIDNFSTGRKEYIPPHSKVIIGNVSDKLIFKDLYKEEIDYIFHFGGPSSSYLFKQDPASCFYTEVAGFLNILSLAREINARKVIYASSCTVYGDSPIPFSEDMRPRPCSLYAVSKVACEYIARLYSDVPTLIFRIFTGYGPREEHKGCFASVVTQFLKAILEGKRPIVFGDGTQSRDFIYIEDIVKAIIRGAEREVTGIINLGSGRAYTYNHVIELINYFLGKNIEPLYVTLPRNYVYAKQADITKMKKLLGVSPLPLKDGLQKYILTITSSQ